MWLSFIVNSERQGREDCPTAPPRVQSHLLNAWLMHSWLPRKFAPTMVPRSEHIGSYNIQDV